MEPPQPPVVPTDAELKLLIERMSPDVRADFRVWTDNAIETLRRHQEEQSGSAGRSDGEDQAVGALDERATTWAEEVLDRVVADHAASRDNAEGD